MMLTTDINKNQIFQGLFIATVFCFVYSKPYVKRPEDPKSLAKSQFSAADIERQKIISELKEKILSRLNLESPSTGNSQFDLPHISQDMKDLLQNEVQNQADEDNDERNLQTITAPLTIDISCLRNQSVNRECFAVTIPNLDTEEIKSVKLIALLKADMKTAFDNIVLYNFTWNDLKSNSNFQIDNIGGETLEVDMLETFRKVIAEYNSDVPGNAMSMAMSMNGPKTSPPIREIFDIHKMVLEIKFRRTVVVRSKRETNMCEQNKYFCCTQNMTINVEELGLKQLIVAPKTFSINYCKGDCNDYIINSSNNSKALHLFKSRISTEKKETRSCCVPYSFNSLTIMYEAPDTTIKLATFTDMIAATCGCL